ncbi:MAG: HlyC/CorC family transporter [Clostridia bacterium]|nr:HlyC/CorC family transporter [Clostridia bacterium]
MQYFLLVLLLMGSAFFSGTEIAFTSLNKLRLKKEADRASRAEKLVLYICNHYENALSTVLIGNNLVNIGATSIATVIAVSLASASQGKISDQTASSIVTVLMTVIILIVGEITPKMLAKRYNETIVKVVCWPLMVLMIIFFPAVFISTRIVNLFGLLWRRKDDEDAVTITEEDLESILDTVEDEGIIDENQTELLQSALEFTDLEASDILTPRIDVIGLEINDSLDKVLEIINESQFSRYPVYDRTIDHVVGVIYAKHLLRELVENKNLEWQSFMLNHIFIPESMKLHDIMEEFRKNQMHMAIVADEYGGTAGIVTMEDVLEQLVGEIWDENDDIVADWQKITDTRYECSGDMNLSEFCDELDLDEEDLGSDCATVGGWATDEIGAMPVEFDAFDFKHITVIVKSITESHRIEKLIILLHQCPEDD